MLTKADKWLVIALLAFAISGIGLNMYYLSGASAQGKNIVISVNGQVVKTVPLRQGYNGEFRIDGTSGFNVIEYKDGHVHMKEADCPDQICVQSGWIHTPPQQLVCLPYRVVVKVVADSSADIDDIVR